VTKDHELVVVVVPFSNKNELVVGGRGRRGQY
jgi:hypothetical protein